MPSRNSHILIWTCVALLTLGVHAAALYLIHFPEHKPPEKIIPPVRVDLSLLQPAPSPEPFPEPAPEPPSPEPVPEPPPKPERRESETAPPVHDPPIPLRPDPAIIKKQLAEKFAAERLKQEQLKREKAIRGIARKRLEEKRRKEKAARDTVAKKQAAARKRAALAKQIKSKAIPTSRKLPTYPLSARKAGHQGTTILRITIGTNGRVTSARIKESSGHTSLDRAALSVVRYWNFSPAINGLGQKIPYTTDAPIPFKLR